MVIIRLVLVLAFVMGVLAVKKIKAKQELDTLLKEAGSRPVVLEYFSESCGPCVTIYPIWNALSKQYAGRAYFRMVDIEAKGMEWFEDRQSALPTFEFWMGGKTVGKVQGAFEKTLEEWIKRLVQQADRDDMLNRLKPEQLAEFYGMDPSNATNESIQSMTQSIREKSNKDFEKMVKKMESLHPKLEDPGEMKGKGKGKGMNTEEPSPAQPRKSAGAKLKSLTTEQLKATLEQLKEELASREEEAVDERYEIEELRRMYNPCSINRQRTEGAIERVAIIGGGPGGVTAAIYAARANLCPVLIAPTIGGQLMQKGVDVENYPGMPRENGAKMVQAMKQQARNFFTEVIDDTVLEVNTMVEPFEIKTNTSGSIIARTIIVATGADSRWLEVEGEYEYRGGGISSCATCDGYLYKQRACAVIGGGDTAMEEASYLSRICGTVTLIHRRDTFRASKVLQDRVLTNGKIHIRWNSEVARFSGTKVRNEDGEEKQMLTHVEIRNVLEPAQKPDVLKVDAAFVAIGHIPHTAFLRGKVELDTQGFILPQDRSTRTSVPGIFWAGDVADSVYRQAVTSAGSGAMAALDVEKYLSENSREESKCVQPEDFSNWTREDVRVQAQLLGISCSGCTEKSQFVAKLRDSYHFKPSDLV